MAAYNRLMVDENGDAQYPITTTDCVFLQKTGDNGTITQQKLTDKLSEMETSFQDGVDTIVAALTELGVTPESTTPAGIAAAIKKMYTDRYDSGVEQGHQDVIADPGAFGLITEDEYKKYGEVRYNAGITYADSRVNEESKSYTTGVADGKIGATSTVSATISVPNTDFYGDNAWCRAAGRGRATATLANGNLKLTVYCRAFAEAYDISGTTEEYSTTNNAEVV